MKSVEIVEQSHNVFGQFLILPIYLTGFSLFLLFVGGGEWVFTAVIGNSIALPSVAGLSEAHRALQTKIHP